LVLFTTSIAFLLGLIFMLPDDLENLCQSVVASNFSANNILMKITSENYWAVKNDYKPLMHTWSLGIEEQFYLIYPFIFFLFKGEKRRFIFPLLVTLTALSLILFLLSNNSSSKFYFLQYRFFELSIGGLGAIYFSNRALLTSFAKSSYILYVFLFVLLFILYSNSSLGNDNKILLVTALTSGILILGKVHFAKNATYRALLSNKVFRGIGKISFSLYLWHHIVFAFSRYFLLEKITFKYAAILSIFVVLLSILSFYLIENPFRNKKLLKTRRLLIITSLTCAIITISSLYVYVVGGIIKDVPELGISMANRPAQLNFFDSRNNINIQYNENVRALDKPFSQKSGQIRILVIGNSFGRDVSNILLESTFKDKIELRYSDLVSKQSEKELKSRFQNADFILFASNYPTKNLIRTYNINMNKVTIVGTKDFGNSNGIHYNRKIEDYENYRTLMKTGVFEQNSKAKKEWGEKYIDLISLIADPVGRVLVFTPDGKFISQDTVHLTKFGAKFFAKLLENKFKLLFK
jgi:peptidoglycan/LPS O-acetylase OafA/YrhL